MCEEFGFDSGFETIDFDDGGDAEIETLDFDDGGDAGIEILDFDDSEDTGIETLDFDDSEDTGAEISDFEDGEDTGIETLDFGDGDAGIEILDFDDSGDIGAEISDFEDGEDTGIETLDFGDGDAGIEMLDFDDGGDTGAENITDNKSEISNFYDGVDVGTEVPSINDGTNSTDANDYYNPVENDNPCTPMSDEELGDFVDWENTYASEIDAIQSDPTLSDAEKSELLQSSYNDFIESSNNNYTDADIEDNGPVKILTKNPDQHYNNAYASDSNSDFSSYNDTDEDINVVSDVDNWISDINPNFDPFDVESPYCNNCGSCAYAVYQRMEGNPDICASAENIGYNSEMEALTGMEQVSMSPEDIEQSLLEQGDGAHAIIGIDRAEGPGHWFNAACIDGKVVAIDGQSGEINDWPPDYGDVVNWEMSVKKG